MQCTYCQSNMQITTVKVKRPVPPGARDLGLEDDVYRWQCPSCELVSDEGVWRCGCGTFTVIPDEAANAPLLAAKLLVSEPGGLSGYPEYKCSQCVTCSLCGKSLAETHPKSMPDKRDPEKTVHQWYHPECFTQRVADIDAREAERRRQLEEQQAEARRRKEEQEVELARQEAERQEEVRKQEAIRRLEEQQLMERQKKEDDVRNRRIRLDQCITCGRKLGMGDKLFGRQVHKACKDKPMRMI